MTTDADQRVRRIVEARQKLRERFLEKMRTTPSASDPRPQGSGAPNRHGMPRLPPGQRETEGFPVLDLGVKPEISLEQWRLRVDVAVEEPATLGWAQFNALPQVEDTSDFHCVTTWSKLDVQWKGVQFSTLAALVRPLPGATHVLLSAYDGYTTNLPLEEALKDDVLLAHRFDGKPLSREHGGPLRMVTPQLYAWKGAKWINRIEFLTQDRLGFWEVRGYSNSAHPWRDDRYS